jgi:hypothetical protein
MAQSEGAGAQPGGAAGGARASGVEALLRLTQTAGGALGVVVFLYTGLYMRSHFPAAYEGDEAIRYLYRANHLYIMFSSVLNLVVGRSLVFARMPWRRALQIGGSVALLAAMALLIAAFFREPQFGGVVRQSTLLGCVLALGGSLVHAIATERRGQNGKPPKEGYLASSVKPH